ncbi:hypothetical protein [Methylobacter sp.]
MNQQENVSRSPEEMSVDELEALMASFDDEIVETVPENDIADADVLAIKSIEDEVITGEVEESILAKAMKAIASKEISDEIYENQTSGDDHLEVGEKVKAKVKAPKAAKEPRMTKFTHSVEEIVNVKAKPDFYLLEMSDLKLDEQGQKDKHKAVMTMINAMNVKTKAKCLNLLSALNGAAKLSTFIDSGVRYILSGDAISNADMIDYFMHQKRNKVKSYGKSTATPQATNLLKLFTELKMLNKSGATYEINNDSLLVASFKSTSA